MALSKTTSTVLKTGVTIAGTAAAFTPVGGLVGLTGAAAVAADVVGGAVIGGVANKLGHKAKSEIDKNTDESKDKSHKLSTEKTAKNSASESATSHVKSKSSTLKKAATISAAGVGTLGLAKLLNSNKNGRSTSATTNKFATDLKKIQDSSTKNYQKDLARAGVVNTGSAAQQASMS